MPTKISVKVESDEDIERIEVVLHKNKGGSSIPSTTSVFSNQNQNQSNIIPASMSTTTNSSTDVDNDMIKTY